MGIFIGNHVSSSGGFEAMGKRALDVGGNTFAFFTRNPRGGSAAAIDPGDAEKLIALMEEHSFGKLVAHAPYTMNLCAAKDDIRTFSRNMLADDIKRMEYIPGNYYNFHPGSHVGQGEEEGIRLIAQALKEVIDPGISTTVLLETMAGKGSEVGKTFEELARIMDILGNPEKLGVCLDTCHVWDGGYDIVGDLEGVLKHFDDVIGLERLYAVHINDSKNPLAAHKDRHEKIGQGCIGAEALKRVVSHPALKGKPFILETPCDDDGYREEIRMIRKWTE
ncbi:MAG: deoxyribonuclease IV [Lachnospiraceae bacterium]|nr:deoxyribonuclease IV [Lachnospiraceae bacterium]